MMKTILTVDDSPSIRQMLAYVLSSNGYKVIEAEDGEQGLEMAKATQADLVLTDQNMPKMDGIALIKALRALPNYKKTPIMMLTTESSQALKQQGRDAGATGWMVKPFDPEKLLEMLKRAFAQTTA
ncbi:MAG: response regulator [Betaproteobacteria bacterium]|nr:response regulator [Betaproteobacteria bacterium]